MFKRFLRRVRFSVTAEIIEVGIALILRLVGLWGQLT